jgi:hypothetical protein
MSQRSAGRGCLSQLFFYTLSGQLGCVGAAVVVGLAALVLFLLVQLAIQVVKLLVAVGGLYGAVITVRNYFRALVGNVGRSGA